MKNNGWIDRDGKFWGINCMEHLEFAKSRGYLEDNLIHKEGWIKISTGCMGLYIFHGQGNNCPNSLQQLKVYKWLKSYCFYQSQFDKVWKEFLEECV